MIGKSPTFVSHMERGTKRPALETVICIADVLHTSMDTLLAESRMDLPETQTGEFSVILNDCVPYERFVLLQTMKSLKAVLREAKKSID